MSEKLEMASSNIIQENIDYIASKFPNTLKEVMENGKLVKKIDFDVLKQELSNVLIDEKQERYQMTWPEKKKSILLANSRINATLRPDKEKSVDFDNTKNLYIEGDNLDVLKLLRETYLNKVKMIYIDPPYNTGNDFVYKDDFKQSQEEYLENSGQFDDQGNRLFTNNESNGKYHTAWLNMMYPRLKVARDLLTDDGVIFISIDDNEVYNLKKICDEIFNSSCFCGVLIQNKGNAQNDAKNLQKNHEYILVYFKNSNSNNNSLLINPTFETKEVFTDQYGTYYKGSGLITGGDGGTLNKRPKLGYTIYYNERTNHKIAIYDYDFEKAKVYNDENTVYKDDENLLSLGYVKIRPPKKGTKLGCWTWSLEKFNSESNSILITKTKNSYSIVKKMYTNEKTYTQNGKLFVRVKKESPSRSILDYSTAQGTSEVTNLLENKIFNNPKNLDMIIYLINLLNDNNFICIDFFSGSATTAQAVMKLNAEDNGNRKFIMVQLPEKVENDNYSTICDIGEERIRRAGKKIKEEVGVLAKELDTGFRVLKLDSSNMTDVYYNPNSVTLDLLSQTVDNIKTDRTPLDLLFQVMLELGIELSAKIEERNIAGKKCFIVNENDIVACFDDGINDDVTKELANINPLYAVFRDSSFESDSANINCEQIFKSISPSTIIKVL